MAGAPGLLMRAYPRVAADIPAGMGFSCGAGTLSISLPCRNIFKRGGGGRTVRHNCFLSSSATPISTNVTKMASRRGLRIPTSEISLAVEGGRTSDGGACGAGGESLHSAAETAVEKSLFLQVGARTMDSVPFPHVFEPEPSNLDHGEKSVRLNDSRFRDNVNNTQMKNQFQVTFRPDPGSAHAQSKRTSELVKDMTISLSALLGLSAFGDSEPAHAAAKNTLNPAYGDVGAVLEVGVQLLYLGALLTLLGVGSFLVVRQVLIKRELETAAKDLQDRVRKGDASSLDYFELGAVMLRKKFYQLARKYLNEAIKKWDGSEQDLAQVYNALGYSFFTDGKVEQAISEYEKAVKLQPMYVTAWNNLADAYENQNKYSKALNAYEEALQFDPKNKIASAKRDELKKRVARLQGFP